MVPILGLWYVDILGLLTHSRQGRVRILIFLRMVPVLRLWVMVDILSLFKHSRLLEINLEGL